MFGRKKRRAQIDAILTETSTAITLSIGSDTYDSEAHRIAAALKPVIADAQNEWYIKLINRSHKPEEEVKRTLIFCFMMALGYDTSNSRTVAGERSIESPDADKYDKYVDYSITHSGVVDRVPQEYSPILLEAKCINTKFEVGRAAFDNAWDQLRNYFEHTPECRLSILTNGIVYNFYACDPRSAVTGIHQMSKTPFLSVDLKAISIDEGDDELLAVARELVPLSFNHFDMTKVGSYVESLKPKMTDKMKTTGCTPEIIGAIRAAVGNTEMLDDETVATWFVDALSMSE